MAVLGLRFCARAFSSCGKRGPLFIAVRGLSLSRPLLLRSTGSRRAGSVIVAHGPSCSVACGIFPDQGSNLCPLHWQAASQPLRHQGSPYGELLIGISDQWFEHLDKEKFLEKYMLTKTDWKRKLLYIILNNLQTPRFNLILLASSSKIGIIPAMNKFAVNRANKYSNICWIDWGKKGNTWLILWEEHNLDTNTWREHEWEIHENMNEISFSNSIEQPWKDLCIFEMCTNIHRR